MLLCIIPVTGRYCFWCLVAVLDQHVLILLPGSGTAFFGHVAVLDQRVLPLLPGRPAGTVLLPDSGARPACTAFVARQRC